MNAQLDDLHLRNYSRNLIERFERDIRLFLEDELKSYYKESWWESGIPQAIRERISSLINNKKKQEPKKIYKKRDLFTFSDYESIVFYKKNWDNIFKSIFHEKPSIQFPFEKLRHLRNDLSHARR